MPQSVRFASFSAIAGAALGLQLTPPMAAVWDYNPPATAWRAKSLVVQTFGPTLESWGALSFADALENGAYEVYGKGFFLVTSPWFRVDYIPNGFAVPLSITWAMIGVWLLLHPQEAVATA